MMNYYGMPKRSTMKRYEELIEMAEWWITNDNDLWHRTCARAANRVVIPSSEYGTKDYMNEARVYLCLLEAELQKDKDK